MDNTITSPPDSTGSWKVARGVYRLADPKITLASVASMVLGACLAGADGDVSWGWLGVVVVGIFCVEAAKNASGEIFDWDSGTDQGIQAHERTPFSGGKRVIVEGLLTRRQTAVVAAVFYALGAAVGLVIVGLREPSVLSIGLLGATLAYFYHAPPLKLAYRGLGEGAVAVSYGPLIAVGTYLVLRGSVSVEVLVASLPLGLAIMAFLWINEFPDRRSDALAGKRTLVVRLGSRRAAVGFAVLITVSHLLVVALPLVGLPWSCLLGLAGLPLAVAAARRVWRYGSEAEKPAAGFLVPAQGWTLLSFLLMSVGTGAGALVGS